MMRRLFSFASVGSRSSGKLPRGKRRSRRYSPGRFASATSPQLAMEQLEARLALTTLAPVLAPVSGTFIGAGYDDPFDGDVGQKVPFLATFTQEFDTPHNPFLQVFPSYSVTIDWDTNSASDPIDTGIAFITNMTRTATGYIFSGRIQGTHLYATAGQYEINVTLNDGFGNEDDIEFSIDVYPMAGTTTSMDIDPDTSGPINEGSSYGLTISTDLPSANFKIDWGDGAKTGASATPAFPAVSSHTYANNLPGSAAYQIFGAVSPDGTNWAFVPGPLFDVVDVLPVASMSGATTVAVGETFTLDFSVTDVGPDFMTNWNIDWNYDGVAPNYEFPVDEFPGGFESFGGFYDGVASATHVYDTAGTYTIYAEGTDSEGNGVFPNVWVVTVTEGTVEAPIADAGGPYTTLADLPITLIGSASGGAGNYTFAWDLDGDDVFGEAGEVGASVTFNPAGVPGVQTVKLKVTDENDVVSEIVEATINVQATGAIVVDNTLHVVGSSTGSDNVSVSLSGGNVIVTTSSGSQSFSLSEVAELNIRTGGGNDVINIAAAVTVPTIVDAGDGDDLIIGGSGRSVLMGGSGNDIIYGGAGDDVLLGGTGNDLILGGAGNDVLVGGGGVDILEGGDGRDLLIGGMGNDVMLGGAGDDILIGGWTIHDGNVAALDNIMAIWSGPGSLNARVALLTAVGGLLESNEAVFDDDAIDLITGGAGADLIIADRSFFGDGAIDLIALQQAQDRLIALN